MPYISGPSTQPIVPGQQSVSTGKGEGGSTTLPPEELKNQLSDESSQPSEQLLSGRKIKVAESPALPYLQQADLQQAEKINELHGIINQSREVKAKLEGQRFLGNQLDLLNHHLTYPDAPTENLPFKLVYVVVGKEISVIPPEQGGEDVEANSESLCAQALKEIETLKVYYGDGTLQAINAAIDQADSVVSRTEEQLIKFGVESAPQAVPPDNTVLDVKALGQQLEVLFSYLGSILSEPSLQPEPVLSSTLPPAGQPYFKVVPDSSIASEVGTGDFGESVSASSNNYQSEDIPGEVQQDLNKALLDSKGPDLEAKVRRERTSDWVRDQNNVDASSEGHSSSEEYDTDTESTSTIKATLSQRPGSPKKLDDTDNESVSTDSTDSTGANSSVLNPFQVDDESDTDSMTTANTSLSEKSTILTSPLGQIESANGKSSEAGKVEPKGLGRRLLGWFTGVFSR